jgi:hypothetical protein
LEAAERVRVGRFPGDAEGDRSEGQVAQPGEAQARGATPLIMARRSASERTDTMLNADSNVNSMVASISISRSISDAVKQGKCILFNGEMAKNISHVYLFTA